MYVLLVFKGLKCDFASKSMIQSKNLKLKLGLCGLALTSFLAINAHSTVHADTVSGSNAGAITWDSDQDDSQVVKEDSNQSQPTQNAQGQAPATQSVQSNVQKRAETSAVRVSNFDSRAVNQVRVNNARPQAKVANVNATVKDDPVQITNPQNNQVIVHYVKSNGQSAGLADQTIDLSNIKYNTTAVNKGGYLQLRKPSDKTTDPNGTDLLSDNADKNIGAPLKTSSANKLANVFNTNDKGNVQVSGADNVAIISIGNKTSMDNQIDNVGGKYLVSIRSIDHCYMFTSNSVNNVTANDIVSNYIDTGGMITDEVSSANQLTKQECADLENWVIQQDPVSINTKTVPVLKIYKDDITNSKIGRGEYNAPSGYTLAKGDGSYKVSSTDNGATASVTMKAYDGSEYQSVSVNDSAVTNDILGIIKDDIRTNYSSLPFQDGSDPMSHVKSYSIVGSIDGGDDSGLNVDFSGGNWGTADGQGVGLTYVYSYYDSHSGQELQGSRGVDIPVGVAQDLQDYYNKYTLNILKSNTTGSMFGDDSNGSDRLIMGDVSMNHSYTFNDSGSATSSVGNHINVPVTQPKLVDPNSSDCRRQAQRIIHVTFPNGVKPKSYDSITDSAGNKLTLDSNNNLTQTVTFTRSKTVDSLTNATLSETPWQQHGAINAVTLPAIPGYTMTQTK